MATSERRAPRSGFAMVAVLAIVIVLSGLISALMLLTRAGIDSARYADDDVVDDALVRAGLELAAYQLFQVNANPRDLNGQQVRLDSGSVTLTIAGESGKIDLNASDPALIASAYTAAGLKGIKPEDFSARVVDWRDADSDRSEGGAEAEDYAVENRDYRPQNDAFRSVDELQFILGLSVRDVKRLRPYFTVFNPQGTINLYDAPVEVLRALPGINESLVKRILQMRKDRSDTALTAMTELLADQQAYISTDPALAFRVTVTTKRDGHTGRKTSAVIIPDPAGLDAYRVVDWAE